MDLATRYDATNTLIFLPSGGSRRLRRQLVEALDVRPGQRALELGCGTGQATAELTAAGAQVVAVDALADMLVAARRRAPTASFVQGDAVGAEVGGGYDHVVIAFVLHNLDADGRVRLLRRAREALGRGGHVGILDWAVPSGAARGVLWRRFLAALEPSSTVPQILDGGLDLDIATAGLTIARRRRPAGGRTQLLVLTPEG
jgi:demethylmenaquinone methyltransferase/2-methoxy-6-polyprenyl-1,4-benzoquinol methylase